MSFSRKNIAVIAAGIAVTGLVLFSVVLRGRLEANKAQIENFKTTVIGKMAGANTGFKSLTADADLATVDKEVIAPLREVSVVLQNLYEGKEENTIPSIRGDERLAFSVKLILMEIERTEASITAKVPADFDKATVELNKLEGEFETHAQFLNNTLNTINWLTIIISFSAFGGIAFVQIVSDRRSRQQALDADQLLKKEKKRVQTLSGFIEAMATGNYSIELETDKNDEFSTTLVTMRDRLKIDAEDDKRRNWATSGLAQIGEILRASSSTSSALYESIVKFVVKYTNSNQGGLFIFMDDDSRNEYLELVACYAFERKKFLQKRIDIGQGLVGQCYLEKERIHLREVPQDYVRITSGLGGENPKSCLLVPLKVNDKVFGVLELASFQIYHDFEIDLVEKFAETIAATISSVQINESTRVLLERTQQQAEEMKSQEEEMRQNMEELSATQEEMQRKEREYIQRIQELEDQQAVLAR